MKATDLVKSLSLSSITSEDFKVVTLYKGQHPDVFLVDNFGDGDTRSSSIEPLIILESQDYLAIYNNVSLATPDGKSVFTPLAIAEFAQVADAYLVATAAAKGYVLVTNETSDPLCRRRVKIPDACNALGVRYCDLNQVLRELGITI